MKPNFERNEEQEKALGEARAHLVCFCLVAFTCIVVGSVAYGYNGFLLATLFSIFVFVVWWTHIEWCYDIANTPVPGQKVDQTDNWPK